MTASRLTTTLSLSVLLASLLGVASSPWADPAVPDASLALVRGNDGGGTSTGAKINCDDNLLPLPAGQITFRACALLPNAQAVGQVCMLCEIMTGPPTYANDTGPTKLAFLYDVDCSNSFQVPGTCVASPNPKTTGYCKLGNSTKNACIGKVKWYKEEAAPGGGGGP